jgi:chemotaxis-related protein WspB
MLLLTFTAGANRYAVDVARVVEVLPRVELLIIPHAPAVLAGLLEYRGSVVPVLDLGLLLGSTPCQDCLSTRIILLDDTTGDQDRQNQDHDASRGQMEEARANRKANLCFLGLVAEHVSDLIYAQPEQIKPAPVLLPLTPYLGAIVQTDHGIVQLIVVERVRPASIQSSYPGQDSALHSKLDPASLIA